MIKKFAIILFIFFLSFAYGQSDYTDTSIVKVQEFNEINLPHNYHFKYKQALRRVRRVYPLALHAAYIVDSLETELESVSRKRLQKKIARKTHRDLKNDFKYLLRSLYVSEGVVLSKLIYRETGMTVEEIINKYKGGAQATLYTGIANMFDQELDATYDPDGDDFVLECVVRDIKNGKVDFDPEFEIMDRQEYKEDRAEYKKRSRETKKKIREIKREKRKAKRNEE